VVSEGRTYGVEGLDLLGEVVDELLRGRVTGEHVLLEEEGLEQLLLLPRRRGTKEGTKERRKEEEEEEEEERCTPHQTRTIYGQHDDAHQGVPLHEKAREREREE
jgi:hypothetical protein